MPGENRISVELFSFKYFKLHTLRILTQNFLRFCPKIFVVALLPSASPQHAPPITNLAKSAAIICKFCSFKWSLEFK